MSDNNKAAVDEVEATKPAAKPTVVPTPSRYKKKSLLIGAVALVILLALIFGFLLYRHHEHKPPVAATSAVAVCTDKTNLTTLEQAAGAIYTNNVTKQQQAVAKLKEIPNYKRDPNCLNAIVNYYIDISDPQNASLYLSSLEKVYNAKQGFSGVFVNPKTVAQLKSNITFLNNEAKAYQNNEKILNSR